MNMNRTIPFSRAFPLPMLPTLLSVAAVLLFAGCAGTPQVSREARWQCDPAADEAVHSGDWVMARILHESFLIRQPGNCLALYHLGYIMGHLAERQQETEYYQRAVRCGYDHDDRIFFNLGMAYADAGQTAEALRMFQRAVALNPNGADNHFGIALMAVAGDQPALAEQELKQAVGLDPAHWEGRLALARLFLDQCRWAEARNQLEAVSRGDPGNPEADRLMELLASRQAKEYAPACGSPPAPRPAD